MSDHAFELDEALRLALKFFPESAAFISISTGLGWESFLGAMKTGDFMSDHSCYPYRAESDPDLGLAAMGGLEGPDDVVYARILRHTGFVPQGRALVIPDSFEGYRPAIDARLPFVCHSRTVLERLTEFHCFNQFNDTIFIYKNGLAIFVDHDERVHWSRSRMRIDLSSPPVR